jgi:hypothetical protein
VLATRLGIGVYDETWYDYRMSLFEAITVPCMKAQTSRDFDWLIVVDKQMPPLARQRLDAAIAGVPRAEVLSVEFKSDFRKAIVDWGKDAARLAGREYILSSRLDDDDALRVDFFERLRFEADDFLRRETGKPRRGVFSFTLGTMWVPSTRFGYTRYHDSHSLGLSVVEPIATHRSVYYWTHPEIKQRLAPQGAYIRGVDGDDIRWWLYAAHPLAVTDRGDNVRYKKVMEHKHRYRIDDDFLATFGVDASAVDALAETTVPQQAPDPQPLSTRAMDLEHEIKALRGQEDGAGMWERRRLRRRIEELQAERRRVGSNIVASEQP